MATPAGNPGNFGENNVMIDQIDSSSDGMDVGFCGLELDCVLQGLTVLDRRCSQILASIPLLQIQLYIVYTQ